MSKKVLKVCVVNTGLAYEVRTSDGRVLCSKPTKKLALYRAEDIAFEFGLEFDNVVVHV